MTRSASHRQAARAASGFSLIEIVVVLVLVSLLAGAAFISDAKAFLDTVEPVLTPHLIADPNSKLSSGTAGHFAQLKRWLEERAQSVLPMLMRREGIDLWLIIGREYNEDPVLETMLPATWMSARRRTILVLHDRGEGQPLERLAVAGRQLVYGAERRSGYLQLDR